jgi:molybdopterin/thiamine biosynthesis adenylyltransferase
MRYSRQIGLVGHEGQRKLASSRVAIIGLGGLGSIVSQLLCRAGVGTLYLYDHDKVTISNLHRQMLYHEGDIGNSKAMLAVEKLQKMNRSARLVPFSSRITGKNMACMPPVELIVDCTDNPAARKAINRHCIKNGIAWVHGAVSAGKGIVAYVPPGKDASHILGKSRQSSQFGPYVALVGAMQAGIAVDVLLGRIQRQLFLIDMEKGKITKKHF